MCSFYSSSAFSFLRTLLMIVITITKQIVFTNPSIKISIYVFWNNNPINATTVVTIKYSNKNFKIFLQKFFILSPQKQKMRYRYDSTSLLVLQSSISRSTASAGPAEPCRVLPHLETILKTLVNKGFYTISLQNTT